MASSKNDDQASFGSKRPRNDVLQKDGDWICTTCGNLNFSFRIACNRKYCNASKPSGSPAPKPFGSPIPVPKPAGSPAPKPFIAPASEIISPGVATLPPPPLPKYGMPITFGSIPSSIPYGSYGTMTVRSFGPRTSIQAGSSIPPRSFEPIPSIPSGSFGGILVDPRSDINPYGYGFQGPFTWNSGLITKDSKFHKDYKSHKDSVSHKDSESYKRRIKGPDGISKGDWVCPKCENVNFAFRTKCNVKKCRVPRPTPVPLPVFPEGSWSCNKCGNMNYPYRNTCNMKGCRVERPASDN